MHYLFVRVLVACLALALLPFATTRAQVIQVSEVEAQTLENFFRYYLTRSEGGYVLFGVKPVCSEGIYIKGFAPKYAFFKSPAATTSELLRRGLACWNRVSKQLPGSLIRIFSYQKSDPRNRDFQELLWINKLSLQHTINEHLPLFRLVLSPTLTTSDLVQRLCCPDETMASCLKNRKELIGLVLGYGLQSSLVQSRIEVIEESLYLTENYPLAPRARRAGMPTPISIPGMSGVIFAKRERDQTEVEVSPGYSTLGEEHAALKRQMAVTSSHYQSLIPPIPTFGYITSDSEETRVVKKYAEVQPRVRSLLESEDFLEQTLSLIAGRQICVKVNKQDEAYSPPLVHRSEAEFAVVAQRMGSQYIAELVAHDIWNQLASHDPLYLEEVVRGMKEPGSVSEIKSIVRYMSVQANQRIREQLIRVENALNRLASAPNVREIISSKVYFRTLKSAPADAERTSTSTSSVVVHFRVEDNINDDDLLASGWYSSLKVADLIPGMRLGIQGMPIGEVRELYIHPDYGYGIRANCASAMLLKIRVQLLSFTREASASAAPLLVTEDCLAVLPPSPTEQDLAQLRRDSARAQGMNCRLFYGQADKLFSMEQVIAALQNLTARTLTQEEVGCNLNLYSP